MTEPRELVTVCNGQVSEEKYYISSSLVVIIVWSAATTIMIHHQDQMPLLSTVMNPCRHQDPPSAATSIVVHHHYQMPTRYRIRHYYHDRPARYRIRHTGSTIKSTISDTRSTIIIHDVAAAAALDLRTIRQMDSGEEVKSVTCIDEI